MILRSSMHSAASGLLVALTIAGLMSIAGSSDAEAQSGTAQDRSVWSRSGQSTEAARGDEPARLYAEARADLDAGQGAAAQRKLEILVARFPASPLADVARRDLQRLYAGTLSAPQSGQQPAMRTIQLPPSQPYAPVAVHPQVVQQPAPSQGGPMPTPIREASEDFRHLAGDRIFFADSSIDLGGRGKVALEAQAAWLSRFPGIEVVIEGHSDDHGSREFNRTLAEKRAQAVKLRLNDLGIAIDRMSIAGFGRDRPLADCPEPHCTAQNRRVVTVITRVPPGLAFDITRAPDRSAGVPMR